jgi:hypothetical protein
VRAKRRDIVVSSRAGWQARHPPARATEG